MEMPAHNGTQHKQCQPTHKQVQKADGKAVGLLVTDLFHGPDRVKMTVAVIMQNTPQPLPLPWLPRVPMSTPAKPTAQPSVLPGSCGPHCHK